MLRLFCTPTSAQTRRVALSVIVVFACIAMALVLRLQGLTQQAGFVASAGLFAAFTTAVRLWQHRECGE